MPPSWGGMVGSGGSQMYSLGGRWLRAGQKTPQGHTIDSLDPNTGFLNLSYQGVPLMPLKMRDAIVQDYIPPYNGSGGSGETEADEQRLMNLFEPVQNKDGTWSVPHFGKQVFKSLEEVKDMIRTYGVGDRTGVEAFMKTKKAGEYGTLSDFFNSSVEQRAAGMKVFNNLTGDFTDNFKETVDQLPDPTLDIPFGSDGYIK